MPIFSRQPTGYQMPLTPPDYMPGYSTNGDGSMNLQHQTGHYGYPEKRSFDHTEYRPHGQMPMNQSMSQPMNYASAPVYQQSYQFSGLPPPGLTHPSQMYHNQSASAIRLPEVPILRDPTQRHVPPPQLIQRPRQEPKEEKVVGGVSAHLDYEMDQMADFVHQMVIRVLSPTLANLPAFKKFVSQILSSTRLPSSTILLGLYHLQNRPADLPLINPYELLDHDVHRLLTMALLLASKFLDDNTFQNKSWAEVTGLPVAELNKLEACWLMKIDWRLHIRPDEPKGFNSWVELWERSKGGRQYAPSEPAPMRLLNSTPYSPYHASYNQLPSISNEVPMMLTTPHDNWSHPPRLSNEQSPMSAPPTGPPTPEYFGVSGPWGMMPPAYSMRTMQPIHPMAQQPVYHAPAYGPGFSCWHAVGCTCGSCSRNKELFFNAPYGQPIVS